MSQVLQSMVSGLRWSGFSGSKLWILVLVLTCTSGLFCPSVLRTERTSFGAASSRLDHQGRHSEDGPRTRSYSWVSEWTGTGPVGSEAVPANKEKTSGFYLEKDALH